MAAVDGDAGAHEALASAQAEGRDAGENGLLIPAGHIRNAFLLGGLRQQDVMLERRPETGVASLRTTGGSAPGSAVAAFERTLTGMSSWHSSSTSAKNMEPEVR